MIVPPKNVSIGEAPYISHKIIFIFSTNDSLNITNLMQTFKICNSKTAQHNSNMVQTNNPWVCVIKVGSNGGAPKLSAK